MDDIFDIKQLDKQLAQAVKHRAKTVPITIYQLSVLIGTWKNQNYARSRANVVSVTETDQNPA